MISPAYFSLLLNSTCCPSGRVYFSFFSLAFSRGVKLIAQYFSLIVLTSSNSALVLRLIPLFLSKFWRCDVTSLPARSILSHEWAKEYPSYTGMTCVTPSPESRTIPVDFPVANLNRASFTVIGLPGQQHRLRELGIFRRRFRAFFFCVWWDSCWLQWEGRGIHWVQFLTKKKRVSRGATYHPSSRWLHGKWDISICRVPVCWYLVILQYRSPAGWQCWGSRLDTLVCRLCFEADLHGGKDVGTLLLSAEADLHEATSLP